MADNIDVVLPGSPSAQIRSRDVGGGLPTHVQRVDIGPWLPALVSGHQYNLSVTTGAAVTLTVPAGATHCLVSIDSSAVRYREDAVNPTSTDGMLLPDGFFGELPIPNALRFIAITATAKLNVSYRRYV